VTCVLVAVPDAFEGSEIPAASALALADLGADAPLVLVVGVPFGPNRLFRTREGRFEALPLTELADPFGAAHALAAADFDADGIEEIWVANAVPGDRRSTRADRLFDPIGNGFRDLLVEPRAGALGAPPSSVAVRPLDRLGSGRYGFLAAPIGGPLRLIELDDEGGLVDVAAAAGLDEVVEGAAMAHGSLFGRGRSLFVGAGRGASLLFQETGLGRWVEVGEAVGVTVPDLGAVDAALFEVDQAGTTGLCCLRRRGAHLLWVPDPTGLLKERAPPSLARPSSATALLVADLDNDGFDEILIANAAEPNRLLAWREQGWRPIDPGDAMEPASLPSALAAADIDGDGRLEVIVARVAGRGGGLGLFRVDAPDHTWLRVAPRTPQGAPARGALVRLVAGGRAQTRIVGESARGAGEPIAHFGLGTSERVERLDVRWPDGTVRRFENLPACRTLGVAHPLGARVERTS
jgi:hypothetical protein